MLPSHLHIEAARGRQGLQPLRQPGRWGSRKQWLRCCGEAERYPSGAWCPAPQRHLVVERIVPAARKNVWSSPDARPCGPLGTP